MTQKCSCHGSGGHLSQTAAGTLERPRYSPGLILEDKDLTAAVDYTRNLNRMLFRNLFGCGVICGLTVGTDRKCGLTVTIRPGLALDGCGDPVELSRAVEIKLDLKTAEAWEKDKKPFWVVLCGKEKYCEPRAVVCDSDEFDHATQQTRIRSHAEVTITRDDPKCVCGCPTRDDERPNAQNGNPAVGGAPAGRDEEDRCQKEHEERVECAEDCGCGSACDCGCCVLLARVDFDGAERWAVKHEGIRRLVRPKMVRDREPKRADPPAANTGTSTDGVTYVPPEMGYFKYLDVTTGKEMEPAEVLERVGTRIAKSGGTTKMIRLADLGLAPTPEAMTAFEAKRISEAEEARLKAAGSGGKP